MLNKELDELDRKLLSKISERPGIMAFEVAEPFLREVSENTLWYRIRKLDYKGYIRRERTTRGVKCYPLSPEVAQ